VGRVKSWSEIERLKTNKNLYSTFKESKKYNNKMRKKHYNAAYFLIHHNNLFEHSFGIRLKIVGLNAWIVCYGLSGSISSSVRVPAAGHEK